MKKSEMIISIISSTTLTETTETIETVKMYEIVDENGKRSLMRRDSSKIINPRSKKWDNLFREVA